jgi:PAT family beta-lactamase induction signal transducer AmpG
MNGFARVYLNRRMAALLCLGFASGLPLALTADTLQGWLTDAHIDLKTAGAISLVGIPYALKFLWSPLMDRFSIPGFGRRRGWMLVTQLLLIGSIATMALCDPGRPGALAALAALAVAVAFFSASQDIVIDAYRADVLAPAERGAGAAVSVAGYRIAMIVSGAGALLLIDKTRLSWPQVYLVMAACMSLGLVATLIAPRPPAESPRAAAPSLADATIAPLRQFLLRPAGALVLAIVLLFKIPEYLAASVSVRFILDSGVSKTDLAVVRQWLGIGVLVVGALAGGAMVNRIGMWRSLFLAGVFHSVSNFGFLLICARPGVASMTAAVGIENFCVGLTTSIFAAFLMSQCDAEHSATQYALLTAVMGLSRVASGPPAGWMAFHFGWTAFFIVSAVAGLPGMLLLLWLPRDRPVGASRFFRPNANRSEAISSPLPLYSGGGPGWGIGRDGVTVQTDLHPEPPPHSSP